MNLQLPAQRLDKSEFLAWLDGQQERYELAKGSVVMMTRATRAHAVIVSNLLLMLHGQLDPRNWIVLTEFGLDAGPTTLRFPDVIVDRARGAGNDHTATAPALAAEVLSPSTAAIDLGDKAAEYLQLSTLRAYLVFAQDCRKAWIWVRGSEGFPAGPRVVEGEHAVIEISALNLRLPLSEIYAGVETN